MNSPRNGNRTVKYHLLPLLYERLLIERYFIEERLWNGYVTVNTGPLPFVSGPFHSFWACTVPFLFPFRSFRPIPFRLSYRSGPFRYRSITPSSKNRRRLLQAGILIVLNLKILLRDALTARHRRRS